MDDIVRISSSAPWEPISATGAPCGRATGWRCRAAPASMRMDNWSAVDRLRAGAPGDHNIAAALRRLGLGLERVVRTRVYVTELDRFGDVARAHQEMFGAAPPASTVVQITRLVHPDMLIEIEADAYAGPAAATAARPGAAVHAVPASKGRAPRKGASAPAGAHSASRRAGASARFSRSPRMPRRATF